MVVVVVIGMVFRINFILLMRIQLLFRYCDTWDLCGIFFKGIVDGEACYWFSDDLQNPLSDEISTNSITTRRTSSSPNHLCTLSVNIQTCTHTHTPHIHQHQKIAQISFVKVFSDIYLIFFTNWQTARTVFISRREANDRTKCF